LVCPALDARKGEVYWAVYDPALTTVRPPQATTQAAMLDALAGLGDVRVFGTGSPGQAEPRTPSAFHIAVLAMKRNPNPIFDPAAVLSLEPFYLRPPEAEVARKKRELSPR